MQSTAFMCVSLFICVVHAGEPQVRSNDLHVYDKALLVAARKNNYKTVESLILDGANVNICDENGNTPLHFAAHNNHLESLRILLGYGAFVNEKNNAGFTPTNIASMKGHGYIADILFDKLGDQNIEYTNYQLMNRIAIVVRARNIRKRLKTRCLGIS